MSNLKLNDSIDNTLINIENNINSIQDIFTNIYNAVLTLDEKKWNTKEKLKFDEEFVPYLKIITTTYPESLKQRLEFTRAAVEKYRNIDQQLKKAAENLEDLSSTETSRSNYTNEYVLPNTKLSAQPNKIGEDSNEVKTSKDVQQQPKETNTNSKEDIVYEFEPSSIKSNTPPTIDNNKGNYNRTDMLNIYKDSIPITENTMESNTGHDRIIGSIPNKNGDYRKV